MKFQVTCIHRTTGSTLSFLADSGLDVEGTWHMVMANLPNQGFAYQVEVTPAN